MGKNTVEKIPFLKPIIKKFNEKILFDCLRPSIPVNFSGWGMTTRHENAWIDKFACSVLRQTYVDLEKFNFTPSTKLSKESMDDLRWRHYFISFSINYSIKFAQNNNYNFVECGVGDGITAYTALNEISNNLKSDFKIHLYDAWSLMKKENLLDSESTTAGNYYDLSLIRTKSNLKKFEQNIIYHEGYIPDSFNQEPKPPESIVYLHIDLNSAKSTLSVLNFFFPNLVNGGIIIFDDYGDSSWSDTKNIVDEFFSDKNGILSKLPTGQAIYFHNINS